MTIGLFNPLPFCIGGGETPVGAAHAALRDALGGPAGKHVGPHVLDGGVEDAWRFCLALGSVVGDEHVDAAALEFFPQMATYGLERWEDQMGLERAGTVTAKREQVAAQFAGMLSACLPVLQAQLRAQVDPAISVGVDAEEDRKLAGPHRYLADRTSALPFGPRASSPVASFASSAIVRILWPGLHDDGDLAPVHRIARAVLPAWQGFTVANGYGFVLGATDGLSYLGRRALAW